MNLENEGLELEEEKESDNEEEREQPFSTKDIKVTPAPLLITNIVNRLKHNEIDLMPDFQRSGDLWNRPKMSRLIESILLRLPLPIFYFDVSDQDKWVVIDGLQRLSAIKKFIVDDNLKLGSLEFLKELDNKRYSELGRSYQRIIEETQILTYQVEAQTPKEVKYSIFNRINTGGLSLNLQEVRQALNQKGKGVQSLKEIACSDEFRRIVNIKSKRMIDRELVLRFIAFKHRGYNKLMSSMSNILDETMEYIDNPKIDRDILKEYNRNFRDTLIFLEKLENRFNIGEKNILFNKTIVDKSKTKTLNRSLFEVWTVICSNLSYSERNILLDKSDKILELYRSLLKNEEFNQVITVGTSDRKTVMKRFEMFEKFIQEVLYN